MRWEILSTKVQEHDDTTHHRKRIEALLVWLYAYMLRLYPMAFRTAFADEMLDVFAMTLREAMGTLGLLTVIWREMFELPMNIICARRRQAVFLTNTRTVWRARQVTRWSSMTLSLFILHNLINPFVTPQMLSVDGLRLSLFYVLLFFTSVSMLLAWRWEHLGGLLTIGSGIALGSFLIFYIGYFRPVEISMIGLALIGILWALPFVIFGIMFCHLSQRPAQQIDLALSQEN